MFDADRPIQKINQDRLNRAKFAKYLARCMLDHHETNSLVIGLSGGFGSGKTSIINMVLEELEFASTNLEDNQKPIVLNFSPWSYSGQNQLIYSFFRRLSSVIRLAPHLKHKEQIIYLLELYVSFFTRQPIPKALRHQRTLWQRLTGQYKEEIYAWESGRDLTMVKAELNKLLSEQKHKMIIIIDNISRIYPEEIKQILQIVKSMGDYANTVYMLSINKEQVVNAINKIDGQGGEEYIEKIIQLPFNVPAIQKQDLEAILGDKLTRVMQSVPETSWTDEYWADIYYSAVKYCFENCRDITRYVNTLNFSYARLKDMVNPVDYFAITAIEVFMPEVYAGIRDNKDLFTDLLEHVYKLDADELQKERERTDEIMNRNQRIPRQMLINLIMKLFPRIRHIYDPETPFYHSDRIAPQLKRVCSPEFFDLYFKLSMQASQIPPAEFQAIIKVANDRVAFDHLLTRLNQDERIIKFIDQLNSPLLAHIPEENIPTIIFALIDNGDLFPRGRAGMLSLSTPMRIHRIIHELLSRIKNKDKRFEMMREAIDKAEKSIFIIVHELQEQGHEHLEDRDMFLPESYRDLTQEQLNILKTLAATRIQNWADSGRLDNHPELKLILYAWAEFADKTQVTHYVEKLTSADKGLVTFLVSILNEPILNAMTKYNTEINREKFLNEIKDFIEPDKLKDRAKAIFEDNYFEKLREQEQLAVMIFLELLQISTTKTIPKTTA